MSYPIFHPDEEAQINNFTHDWRVVGQHCTIRSVMKPIGGENRYAVRTDSGLYSVVLESSLHKRFERSDWGMLRGIWQPKRDKLSHAADKGWERLKELKDKDPHHFHRKIGHDALLQLMQLYDQEKKRSKR